MQVQNHEVVEIDCEQPDHLKICLYFGVSKLPKLIFVKGVKYYIMPSTADRTTDGIQEWLDSTYEGSFV